MVGLRKGFTLIELLIVVAIIAILAAIAVPNFLEAQVRSKVSRTRSDLRSIGIAMEAYRIDDKSYPPYSNTDGSALKAHQRLNRLSTPIAYLTIIPDDPFAPNTKDIDPVNWDYHHEAYLYHPLVLPGQGSNWGNTYAFNEARKRGERWALSGRGPNRYFDAYYITKVHPQGGFTIPSGGDVTYDPTNGTISLGDIDRFGP